LQQQVQNTAFANLVKAPIVQYSMDLYSQMKLSESVRKRGTFATEECVSSFAATALCVSARLQNGGLVYV